MLYKYDELSVINFCLFPLAQVEAIINESIKEILSNLQIIQFSANIC